MRFEQETRLPTASRWKKPGFHQQRYGAIFPRTSVIPSETKEPISIAFLRVFGLSVFGLTGFFTGWLHQPRSE